MFRKKHSTEQDWKNIWNNCTNENSFADIQKLKDEAMRKISLTYDDKAIIGFSGGKDSIVLRHLCDECLGAPNYINAVLQNEYPEFDRWVRENAPQNTIFEEVNALSLEFINEHPEYLFPIDPNVKSVYVSAWKKPTYNCMSRIGKDKLITAKRVQDGNYCGKANNYGCKTTECLKPNITTYNVVADWTHSQLFAYIKYFGLELPKLYNQPDAFKQGTHAWTKEGRVNNSYKETFDRVMSIDSSVVYDSADRLELSRLYLEGKLNY